MVPHLVAGGLRPQSPPPTPPLGEHASDQQDFQISGEFLSLDRRPMVVPSSLKTTLGVRFVGCVDGIDR